MKQLFEAIDEHPGAAIVLVIVLIIVLIGIFEIVKLTKYGPDKCVCKDDDEYED